MRCTLREWQKMKKPINDLLYNCSECVKMNDEWVRFPIGLCWSIINNMDCYEKLEIGEHNNLVLCAISPMTDIRRRGKRRINRRNILAVLRGRKINNVSLPVRDYFSTISNYKFVISPEGNGIDCHRHYEALIAGCIPIVEEHPGIREKYGNCPILYTRNYMEITPAYLEMKYNEMLDKEWDFSKLFLSNYSEEMKNEIIRNGNFWSNRLSGKKWYEIIKI